MAKAFIIQDPHHEYASRFIEGIHAKYGYRAVCCFTDRKRRTYEADAYPIWRSDAIAAICDVPHTGLRTFAARAADAYEIVGVIPHNEECVLTSAEMADAVGLRWNPLDVVRLMRDKLALKEHLRRVAPSVRVNQSSPASTVDDVLEATRSYGRSVLKPNSGFGNRDVAFLDRETPRAAVSTLLARSGGEPLVVEEYVGGEEYFVNGQTDENGDVEIVAIFRYTRVAANGRDNLDYGAHLVRRGDPIFARLVDYTTRVIRATGLVRSPFHLEAKVDERGPCLIEVGARLAGMRNALVCNAVHGGSIDVFDVAAHHYLSDRSYGPLRLRWDVYDSLDVRYVSGVARGGESFGDASSLASVEALECFHSWAKKPSTGRKATTTRSCLTMPWSVVLLAPAGRGLDHEEARVRAIMGQAPRLSMTSALDRMRASAERARAVLRWQIERTLPPLEDPTSPPPRGVLDRVVGGRGKRLTGRNAVRKLQEAGLGLRYRGRFPASTPAELQVAAAMLDWARTYLAQPHPELGRKGAVCPFVAKTIAANGFLIAVHAEADGSPAQLRDLVLSHAASFRRRYPADPHEASSCLLILVPNVPPEAVHELDAVQDETKTYLMKRKMMIAAIHPRSRRPAIHNADFPVLRAPVPCFAVRHMVVQDIVFVAHNREAMLTYERNFGALFAQGKVSNEFGYVDLYEAARARFAQP